MTHAASPLIRPAKAPAAATAVTPAARQTEALPAATDLYRVQRPASPAGPAGHAVGGVHLPAAQGRRGRFDLGATHVAAFALDVQTAVYETFARPNARAVSLSLLGARELPSVRTTASVPVYDARAHAHGWPFVTAARCAATQDEADDVDQLHHLFGVLYASAQRQGAQCVALFDKPLAAASSVLATLSPGSAAPLHSHAGGVHHQFRQRLESGRAHDFADAAQPGRVLVPSADRDAADSKLGARARILTSPDAPGEFGVRH